MADIQILGKLKSATTERIIADAEEIADGGSTVSGALARVKSSIQTHDQFFYLLGMQEMTVVSISAAFTPAGWVHAGDSLDSLRQYLTVTAYGGSNEAVVVTGYTLSGTLTEGTCTITVTYKALTTTFPVTVLAALPAGYTRHDYIMAAAQAQPSEAKRILTKKYPDLHAYSLKLAFGHTLGTDKGNAQDKVDAFVIGGRGSSDWTKEAFNVGVYAVGAVHVVSHGTESGKLYVDLPPDTRHFLEYTNTAESPSYFTVDGGATRVNLAWNASTGAANTSLALCSRQREGENAKLSAGSQCGEFELTALDGTVVGHYIPCVKKEGSDFIIGLYETVEGIFYTASDTTSTTIDNANCLYMAGDWAYDSGDDGGGDVSFEGIEKGVLSPNVQSYLADSPYTGKKFSILGDSISSYAGYVPEGNNTYYPGTKPLDVEDTWWMRVLNALGMTLCVNQSWSGSCVSSDDDAGRSATVRCEALHTSTENPDVIIMWMGINDFIKGRNLGTYDGKTALPQTDVEFSDAYAAVLNKIHAAYPQAELWVCTLPPCEQYGDLGMPEINRNGVSLTEWNEKIRQLALAFNAGLIELTSCWSYQNLRRVAADWWAEYSTALHPNATGHKLVSDKVIKTLDPYTWARVNRREATT